MWDPYLATDEEDDNNDLLAHCPVHRDENPSASVNFTDGVWHCFSCGEGGPIENINAILISRSTCVSPDPDEDVTDEDFSPGCKVPCDIHPWVPDWVPNSDKSSRKTSNSKGAVRGLPSAKMLLMWHEELMANEEALEYLTFIRGLSLEEIRRRQLFLKISQDGGVYYGFPVYDEAGELANVRYYKPSTALSKKRIWSTKGHGEARLYPLDALEGERSVCIVEGEFDTLMLNSQGFPTVTSTGGAGIGKGQKPSKKWKSDWNDLFADKVVYIIPDCDVPGIRYAQHVKEELYEVTEEVCIVRLPFEISEDHGEDVSDYLIRDHNSLREFNKLLKRSRQHSLEEDMLADPQVQKTVRGRWVQDIADRQYRRGKMEMGWEEPESAHTFKEELETPLPPMDFTIQGLHPTGGNSLIVSSFKVGKSTLLLNLVKSLIDDKPFLGKFFVNPPRGRVAFWNYEISRHQFREWGKAINVSNPDKFCPLTLRGHYLPLDVLLYFEWAVNWLRARDVSVLLIDPFARAYAGDENLPSEVGAWLDTVDQLKEEANLDDVIMTAHTGRGGQEQARGASRLEDWPDSLWYLARDFDVRYFHALGRDVDVPEGKLEFDPSTKQLTLVGGSRKQDRIDKLVDQLIVKLADNGDELNLSAVPEILTLGSKMEKMEAIEVAERDGTIDIDRTVRPFVVRLA